MRYFNIGLRIMFGLHYFVFGINKLFVFEKVKAVNQFAQDVIDNLYSTGYLMESVGVVQIICGVLITTNRFFPFSLILAAPITINIFLYTVFTNNYSVISIGTGVLVLFSNIYFIILNREKYVSLF